MRLAFTALALIACAFVAGSLAAATGYGDEARCLKVNGMEETDYGTWQWWPWGYRCELTDGSLAPEQQAATVAGTLVAVLGSFVALSLAWRFRSRAWARGLAVGVVSLAFCGAVTGYLGAAIAWLGGLQIGFGLGMIGYFRLEPERAREGVRVWAGATVAGASAVVVAMFFLLGDSTWLGLVLALPAAALSGALVESLTGRLQTAPSLADER